MEQQDYPPEYIQALQGHDVRMTGQYQAGHGEEAVELMRSADLDARAATSFCKNSPKQKRRPSRIAF